MSVIKLYYDLGQVTSPVEKEELFPLSVDFSSLFVVDDRGNPVNFSYTPEKKIDDLVYRQRCDIEKNGEISPGYCLRLDNKQIIYELDPEGNLSVLNDYDSVVFHGKVDRPGLVNFTSPGNATYLDHNLRWEARAKAEIEGNRCRISFFADVINSGDKPYTGKVFVFPRHHRLDIPRSLSKAVTREEVESFSLSHINGYQVSEHTTVTGLSSFFVLRTTINPIKLVYCYQLQNKTLSTRFQGICPDQLPEMKVYCYQEDFLMGERNLPETAKGSLIHFSTGPSTALQITNLVKKSETKTAETFSYSLVIVNPHPEPKTLLLFSNQGWSNVSTPIAGVEKDQVFWETNLGNNETKKITITFTYDRVSKEGGV